MTIVEILKLLAPLIIIELSLSIFNYINNKTQHEILSKMGIGIFYFV